MTRVILIIVCLVLSVSAPVSARDSELVEMGVTHTNKVVRKTTFCDKYARTLARYADRRNVPIKLVHYIVHIESRCNPHARSRANAKGLMQVWPPTARRMGCRGSLYNVENNVRCGMKVLDMCLRLAKGNWRRAGYCYNGGEGKTYSHHMKKETRDYGRKIMMLMKRDGI